MVYLVCFHNHDPNSSIKLKLFISTNTYNSKITMEVGKRYLYVDSDNKTYSGDVVSINDKMVTIQNRSCESYINSWGLFHIERSLITWTFPLDHLIEGHQYIFTLHTHDDKSCEGTFIGISGRRDSVRLKTTDIGVTSFSLYCVKHIHKI